MQTLFLPGYSIQNKSWLEETIIQLPQIKFTPVYWHHWQTGETDMAKFEYQFEVDNLINLASGPVNILAKSIGSVVAAKAINSTKLQVNKVLFCGLPFNGIPETKKEILSLLTNFNPRQILFIQNLHDPAGLGSDLIGWLPKIFTLITPQSDLHHYPYPDLFAKFLN